MLLKYTNGQDLDTGQVLPALSPEEFSWQELFNYISSSQVLQWGLNSQAVQAAKGWGSINTNLSLAVKSTEFQEVD